MYYENILSNVPDELPDEINITCLINCSMHFNPDRDTVEEIQ